MASSLALPDATRYDPAGRRKLVSRAPFPCRENEPPAYGPTQGTGPPPAANTPRPVRDGLSPTAGRSTTGRRGAASRPPEDLRAARRSPCPEPHTPPSGIDAYPVERSFRQADRLAFSLRAAGDRITPPLARAACGFVRTRGWVPFGFARLDDHARERFGRSGRWVRDLAALGAALETLPALGESLTGGDGREPLGRVAALLIARRASPASLGAWVDLARRVSVRELRAAVREARAAGSVWPPGVDPEDGAGGGSSRGTPSKDDGREGASVGAVPASPGRNEPLGERPHGGPAPGEGCRAREEDDPVDRSLVRFLVPSPVRAAFDEAVDLYRAVEGTEATVTSFVEALVAEALAGEHPPDADRVPLKRGLDRAAVESALARSTGNWQHLRASSEASWGLALAGLSLSQLEDLSRRAGTGGPAELDRQLRELIRLADEIERRLGRLLADMAERGAWSRLRFAGVGHYAEERLGLSRTWGEDRARVARALRRFPLLREAYESGGVGLEAALQVVRILGQGPVERATERAWVRRSGEATVKRLRDEAREVARRRDAAGPADTLPPDDTRWHRSLRREPGMSRERVLGFGRAAVEQPTADVFLRLRLPATLAGDFLAAVEAARRGLAHRVEPVPWHEPWPDPDAPASILAARTFSIRCRRLPAWVGLLALIEGFVLTWDGDGGASKRPRDAVYIRDGWRCTAPGCTSRRNLEDHHLVYRSRGGSDDLANRTCLCRFHHQRGEHGDLASCRGTAPLGIVWRLGRREVGRWFRNERRLAAGRQ